LESKDLEDILSQTHCNIIVICNSFNREIIGMASIYFCKTMMHPKGKSHIEDVVVDKKYRGFGLLTFT